ncbi:hypothetical protein [Halobacillus andaensis]|uniref:hypothetical protein n=1 Tax=Halobacillus andaensis TaxID=1176239 RepID=UPI003D738BC3
MEKKATQQVLENAYSTLEMAKLGLIDLKSDHPKYRDLGLRNLAINGRSVTFIIQNLRNIEEDFDEWYDEIQHEMKSSELCVFFKDLRNEIEKQGKVKRASNSVFIQHFSTDILNRLPRPENVKIISFFMGDELGGSGWEIELPDGRKDKFYLDLPNSIITVNRYFSNPPKNHLGLNLEGKTIEEVSEIYFDYLSEVVSKAYYKYGV